MRCFNIDSLLPLTGGLNAQNRDAANRQQQHGVKGLLSTARYWWLVKHQPNDDSWIPFVGACFCCECRTSMLRLDDVLRL